jgi:hypothetical protein
MTQEESTPPSPLVAHIVEKLALRVAEAGQGRLTALQLMPYVPLSLELIKSGLEHLLDSGGVFTTVHDQVVTYEFVAFQEVSSGSAGLQDSACVACGTDLAVGAKDVLCTGCTTALVEELSQLAGQAHWVEHAMLEHDMLHAAAQVQSPPSAVALARHARYPLPQIEEHLARLGLEGYVHQDVELRTGLMTYTFPAISYPTAVYRQNIATLRALRAAKRPSRTGRDWRVFAWLGGALLGATLCAWFYAPFSFRPSHTPPAPLATEQPAAPPAPPPVPLPQVQTRRVSISRDEFTPVHMRISAIQHPPLLLMEQPPAGIVQEPTYQGGQQWYGVLRLGTRQGNAYAFVLDLVPGVSPVLYVDVNQNGNLADDGPPLANRGTGFFATTLRIPLTHLWPGARFPGYYEAWVFTNQRLWQNRLLTYYSRTQLKGRLTLAGKAYTAYIAERGANDADFTNDGIHIDLDGDGKITAATESFLPGSVLHLDRHAYTFEITW